VLGLEEENGGIIVMVMVMLIVVFMGSSYEALKLLKDQSAAKM